MDILLICTDLYKDLAGGGQFVTRKIIENLPEYNFYYFIDKESITNVHRPKNTKVFKLGEIIDVIVETPNLCKEELNSIKIANKFARSVKNLHFDFVEFPDYTIFGNHLRHALLHHNIKFRCIILSLHGNISKSMELNWDSEYNTNIVKLEKDQFIEADITYGISKRYINENIASLNKNVFYLNPIFLLNRFYDPTSYNQFNNLNTSIFFIGRLEKRKGPDLFIDIVSKLNKNLYKSINMIGDDCFTNNGDSARDIIIDLAKKNDLEINFSKPLSQDELNTIYTNNSILILPVRYDTFNLVALDAIFAGCPIAISKDAGICDFLDNEYPTIPYIRINDINNAAIEIEKVLLNYNEYKSKLTSALNSIVINMDFKKQLSDIYNLNKSEVKYYNKKSNFIYKEKAFSIKYKLQHILHNVLSKKMYNKIIFLLKKVQ